MNRMQSQIAEFHKKFGHPIGARPAFSRPALRVSLVAEEAGEFCGAVAASSSDAGSWSEALLSFEKGFLSGVHSALTEGRLVAAADAIADLLYVAIGAAVEFGIDIEPVFDEVHRANMAKIGGATRADGKTLKPDGWKPPNIRGALARQFHYAAILVPSPSDFPCHCGARFAVASDLAAHLVEMGAV